MSASIALVTGAGSGIGRSIAEALGESGYHVAVSSRRLDDARRTTDAIRGAGGAAESFELDVGDRRRVKHSIDLIYDHFGRIDVLVNNAGIQTMGSLLELSDEEWDEVLGVNLTGTFLCCRSVAPRMVANKGGCIINIASVLGKAPRPDRSHYCASKAGVIAFSRAIALELAPFGIRVNSVCPGTVPSKLLDKVIDWSADRESKDRETVSREFAQGSPLRRMLAPSEIAQVVLFLASPAASAITGQSINVDGGQLPW